MKIWAYRTIGVGVTLALVGGLGMTSRSPAVAEPTSAKAPVAAARAAASRVSAKVTKTDKIKTPKLRWYTCQPGLKCATVKVPLDYDKPKGAKTTLAVLKRPANQPKRKIGTLFVNPGGPGGSATEAAANADFIFSESVLDRFDVVGVDPRGVGYSSNAKCFSSVRKQTIALRKYPSVLFPVTAKQTRSWLKADKFLGKACSRMKGLVTAMSTAQVARDMELMRRAVGDKKLTYFGVSYGSYLGQVYANMYPNRFRALVIDGVLDPKRWAGTSKRLRAEPVASRLRSGEGAWKALREILSRCARFGSVRCSFAIGGDPVAKFARLANRLKSSPVTIEGDFGDIEFSYDLVVGLVLTFLYDPDGWQPVVDLLSELYSAAYPSTLARPSASAQKQSAARLATLYQKAQALRRPGYDFPYENGQESFAAVICTDSRESTKQKKFSTTYNKIADRRDPYFTRRWMYTASVCAKGVFTGHDEDAYKGPFTRRTSAPVLVVGNYFDPATNYAGAQTAARLLPNSRLLSSNSWGHTAYGTSDCVTVAVDNYLLSGKVARAYRPCVGDSQPFKSSDEEIERSHARAKVMARLMGGIR